MINDNPEIIDEDIKDCQTFNKIYDTFQAHDNQLVYILAFRLISKIRLFLSKMSKNIYFHVLNMYI